VGGRPAPPLIGKRAPLLVRARRTYCRGVERSLATVRVLTVDDQALFRGIAREVIEATPGFEFAGEACSGEEALAAVDDLAPQLVLLDVRMPGMDGVEVARRLTAAHPETVVVLISVEESVDVPSAAQLTARIPFVRKRDFGPRLLRRLWAMHGS
jgi:two-component system invasion response regulator UvrY